MSLFDDFNEGPPLDGTAVARAHAPHMISRGGGAAAQQVDPAVPDRARQNNGPGTSDGDNGPMFALEHVDYRPSAEIVCLEVSSNILIMGLLNNHLIRLNLSAETELDDIPVVARGVKEGVDVIRHLFLDPSGTHLLIAMSNAQCFYLHEGWDKPRLLPKMHGVEITAVAWNASQQDSQNTGEILIGTANGKVFSTRIEANNERAFVERLVGGGAKDQNEFRLLYTLDDERAVTGLRVEKFPRSKNLWVLASTPVRIYEFIGGPSIEDLFAAHEERAPRFHELPGDLPASRVQFFLRDARKSSLPHSFAWMTEPGVYFGELLFDQQTTGDSCVPNPAVLQYDDSHVEGNPVDIKARPLAIALTEFHIFVLLEGALVASSTLSHETVWREVVAANTRFGAVRGLARDAVENTLWLYTSWGVFEISINREDRRVWELYLEQNLFEEALRFASNSEQKDRVRTAQADHFFAAGEFAVAAKHYGATSRSFEEITLKFIQLQNQTALKAYLLSKLQFIKARSKVSGSSAQQGGDATQITLIATWLCELYLDEINHAQDAVELQNSELDLEVRSVAKPQTRPRSIVSTAAPEVSESERALKDLRSDFHAFLSSFAKHLDNHTTLNLMTSHGQTESVLYFAKLKGDSDRVLEHLLQHEMYREALTAMQEPLEDTNEVDPELYYRYSPPLMQHLPKETVDAWIDAGSSLSPPRLIPALMRYSSSSNSDVTQDEAIRYLLHCVTVLESNDQAIHNYLLSLYAKRPALETHSLTSEVDSAGLPSHGPDPGTPREDLLMEFLKREPRSYDNKYALRVCTEQERHRACVMIYNQMGLFEEATDLALLCGDLQGAQIQAQSCRDDDYGGLKKKLWLKIARYVISVRKDIQAAMELLQSCEETLKIEDILPFFPDFTQIDKFKKEICSSLEDYNRDIQKLKDDMEEATRAAEDIRGDIAKIRDQYGFVAAGQRCSLCGYPVMTQDFYLFPCQHVVHVECQFGRVQPYLDDYQRHRVGDLQSALGLSLGEDRRVRNVLAGAAEKSAGSSSFAKKLSSYRAILGTKSRQDPIGQSQTGAAGGLAGPSAAAVAQQQVAALDHARDELDDIIAAECTLCGDVMIDETSLPFIDPDDERGMVAGWSIDADLLF